MTIEFLRRMKKFSSALPADPSAWTVEDLDAAFDELKQRRQHLMTADEQILDSRRLEGNALTLRHWIGANVCFGGFPHGMLYGLPASVEQCYLDLTSLKMKQGDARQAAAALARLLRYDPLKPTYLELLAKLENLGDGDAALQLSRRFRFRHVKSFGKTKLGLPVNIAVHPGTGSILVSDYARPYVFVFALSGRFKKTFDLGITKPAGLTADVDDSFLICDAGKKRLVRFDLTGRILEKIPVPRRDVLGNRVLPVRALRFEQDRFILVTYNPKTKRYGMGELAEEKCTPYPGLPGIIQSIGILDGRIVFRDYQTGRLFRLNGHDAPPEELPLQTLRFGRNYGFTRSSQGLFMDCNLTYLFKTTFDGEMEYFLDLGKLFGRHTLPIDMQAFEHHGRELLCIADHYKQCLHLFEI